jgi:predicted polyphosphate/ATP-dependent NAD kinase
MIDASPQDLAKLADIIQAIKKIVKADIFVTVGHDGFASDVVIQYDFPTEDTEA